MESSRFGIRRSLTAWSVILLFAVLACDIRSLLELEPSFSTEASSASAKTAVDKSQTPICHFEDGKGFYLPQPNGSLSWDWVHQHPLDGYDHDYDSNDACQIQDLLSVLRDTKSSTTSKKIALISIGDSLDRNLIERFLCNIWEGQGQEQGQGQGEPDDGFRDVRISLAGNRGKAAERTRKICSSSTVTLAFFKIYGMKHDCENPPYLRQEDRRHFNSTRDRIEMLLGQDILDHLDDETNIAVMASSALWDLSRGCNHQMGVSETYQQLYEQGILDVFHAIRFHLPHAPIFWRTSPFVTLEYDEQARQTGFGRTRENQRTLNQILKDTVQSHGLGTVIDWWAIANQRPEEDRGTMVDGRHYLPNPSLVFYNVFLNTLFHKYPDFNLMI